MKLENVVVRRAEKADLPILGDLCSQLGYDLVPEALARNFEAIGTDPDQSLLVACGPQGTVLGFIHLSYRQILVSDPSAEIEALIVDEEHRSMGIGGRLLDAAYEFGRQKGVRKVVVRSNVIREEAHAFYEENDFVETKRSAVFYRHL